MKCSNCGFEQAEGRFCGKCGSPLVSQAQKAEKTDGAQAPGLHGEKAEQETAAAYETARPHLHEDREHRERVHPSAEKVKATSRLYGAYFTKFIKRPSLIFSGNTGSSFSNGLISMAIVAVLMALSFYLFVHNFASGYFDYGYGSDVYGPSFLAVFGRGLILIAAIMAIVVFLLFLINQLFGSGSSFKEMASIYGAHMVPVAVVAALTLILAVIKSNFVGMIFLFVTLGLIATTVPVYIISSLLTRRSRNIDPFYGYIVYLAAVGIVSAILFGVLSDSIMGEFIDSLFRFM